MQKNILVLSDGTEISSGAAGAAIRSLKLTRSVNDGQQLTLGSACAAMAELTLINVPPGRIAAGDELTLYTENRGARRKQGVFFAQKPEHTGSHTLKLTAYDRMTFLDKDLTVWLKALTGWPYTLQELASLICDACGVTLVSGDIPNGGHPVQRFTAEGITGRQLLRFIGEAAGRFIRADRDGNIEFAWYESATLGIGPAPVAVAEASFHGGCLTLRAESAEITDAVAVDTPHLSLTDDGAGNATLLVSDELLRQYAFAGGLQLADFEIAPIEKVQLRRDDADVGTVYPDTPTGNTYIITGNPLLTAETAETLLSVAQTLYEQLKAVRYTPCSLSLPASDGPDAGSIITVTDTHGNTLTAYIMTAETAGQQLTLTCQGAADRNDIEVTNDRKYESLSGKVMHLRTDVDGIRAENADASGRLSRLELDVDGIRGQVQSQEGMRTELTELNQTAQSLSLAVKTMEEQGASKVVTAFGMRVDGSAVTIAREDSNIENRLDEKGMYVVRDPGTAYETTMLRADEAGVAATDVTVGNFLVVGEHARFENYAGGRTACFYIG